jgi:thioesterase domain-containing protein
MASDEWLENPTLIHEGPENTSGQPAPLVLIHDGGGTTFSYHCMDPTNRPLWAVQNPRLDDGGWWDGGIEEMARHYIDLMSLALPEGGSVILGGRSGGVDAQPILLQGALTPQG